ncbi:hypothetical protein M8J76_007824, partial [Diaphorina citri]
TKFLCSEVIAPVKSEVDDICLYIINFEDLTAPQSPVDESEPAHRLSKFDRARQSFRQSFRMGSLRGRGFRRGANMAPLPSDDGEDTRLAKASSEGDTTAVPPDRTLRPRIGMERSQTTELNTKAITNHITPKRPSVPSENPMPKRNSMPFWEQGDPPPLHTPDLNQNIYKDQTQIPPVQPLSASSQYSKSPPDQSVPSSPQVPHAASLETISLKRPRLSSDIVHPIPNVQIATNRSSAEKSATCSVYSMLERIVGIEICQKEILEKLNHLQNTLDHIRNIGQARPNTNEITDIIKSFPLKTQLSLNSLEDILSVNPIKRAAL